MARALATTPDGHAGGAGVPPLWRLWYGLLGAAGAWAVQLVASYSLIAHACFPARVPVAVPVIPGAHTLAILVSAGALAVAAGGFVVAHAAWNATRTPEGEEREARPVAIRRSHFMALAGMFTSGVFLLAVVMAAFPLFVRPLCAGAT